MKYKTLTFDTKQEYQQAIVDLIMKGKLNKVRFNGHKDFHKDYLFNKTIKKYNADFDHSKWFIIMT